MKFTDGGVCAAKGFLASGLHCGIRKNKDKKDLALIYSTAICNTAAVYTKNLVKGAPIAVTREHIKDGKAQAIICNSGNANTCNADGAAVARKMCRILSENCDAKENDIVVASTGVIGQPLDITPIENAVPDLVASLSEDGSLDACRAIMTTVVKEKTVAVEFELDGKTCHIGGIAKGSGMIHPNMATMLVFITTDAAISTEMLKTALSGDVKETFNMLSIDGDTSTNDMEVIMANGLAGNREITGKGDDFDIFVKALNAVTAELCAKIAADGEGATKLLVCKVSGAADSISAKKVAKSVICSSLLKAAMFGADANWGRVLCAIGYSGADVDVNKIDVSFKSAAGEISVCKNGSGIDFSEEKAKKILLMDKIEILVSLNSGDYSSTAWGCDLTYDYVKINGDYRT